MYIYKYYHDYSTRSCYHQQTLMSRHKVQVVVYASHHVIPPKKWPMWSAWSLQSTSYPQHQFVVGPLAQPTI